METQPVDPALPVAVVLPPKTTLQEDLALQGQRRINLVWEWTQAVISVIVVTGNVVVGVAQGLNWSQNLVHPPVLSSALFLIVGFYFSRTNHTNIGGIGKKPAGDIYGNR